MNRCKVGLKAENLKSDSSRQKEWIKPTVAL